jgi:hypothetical protein
MMTEMLICFLKIFVTGGQLRKNSSKISNEATAFGFHQSFSPHNQKQCLHMMNKHRKSLSETLKNLISSGYSLADAEIAALPDESLQSDDWRLDKVEQIWQEQGKALVIAVSSVSRCMKLIFVEVLLPQSDFSLMTLLRRLFPMQPKTSFQLSPAFLR